MALYIGNTLITKLYKGNTELKKLYLGNTLIYSGVNTDFVMSVKTDNAGTSNNNQFTLPLVSSFNGITANVDWGDGTSDAITSFNQSEVLHTYPSSGNYTITISNALRGWQFANGGDKSKAINISNWGIFEANEGSGFWGCSNLNSTATDSPLVTTNSFVNYFYDCATFNGTLRGLNLSSVTSLNNTFRGTLSLVDLDASLWDVSNLLTAWECFGGSAANPDVTNWDTSSMTSAYWMFAYAPNFDRNMAAWDISGVLDLTAFMTNSAGLSTANYDATLIGWANQIPLTYNGTLNFGNSVYTLGGAAATARADLVLDVGGIQDGGGI